MYYEELDHDNGPFKVYLSMVAPMLMKAADEATMKDLVRMIKQGGGFAELLFIAATTVSSLCLLVFDLAANHSGIAYANRPPRSQEKGSQREA